MADEIKLLLLECAMVGLQCTFLTTLTGTAALAAAPAAACSSRSVQSVVELTELVDDDASDGDFCSLKIHRPVAFTSSTFSVSAPPPPPFVVEPR